MGRSGHPVPLRTRHGRGSPSRPRSVTGPGTGLRAGALLVGLLLLTPPGLRANGGTVRISRAPLGPYQVTVYSSPTPLRTGEVDVSVLVQDSADAVLDRPVRVEARPLRLAGDATAGIIRREATRAQATNKLFKAAKFDVDAPGEWSFHVEVADAGSLAFQATVARTTLLDRPYLLAFLILLPLAVAGWLLLGRDDAA